MRFPDTMDSRPQSIWFNRRVQRMVAFALFFVTLVTIGLYRRNSLPSIDSVAHIPTSNNQPDHKSSSPPKAGGDEVRPAEEPLYPENQPEYDPHHMPAIPITANKNSSIFMSLDHSRVALIIETRPSPHLPALLSSFIATLPPQWVVKLVGAEPSFNIVRTSASLTYHINSGKLLLSELPGEFPTTDNEALSATLTNYKFYADFLKPAEWILLFQTDSIICSASEQSLDDWVKKGYSWVGAPWHLDRDGGNGGLSLRHVPSILKVLEKENRTANGEWEDLWFSSRLENLAPGRVETAFSVESLWHERPLGYHLRGSGLLLDEGIWQDKSRKRHILEYCPEVKLLLGNMGLQSADDAAEQKKEAEDNGKKAQANAVKEKKEAEDKGGALVENIAKKVASAVAIAPTRTSTSLLASPT